MASLLCENRADTSFADTAGKTVLYKLTLIFYTGNPINPALLNLMLSHRTDINYTDIESSTVLYLMAKNLRQINTVNFLISQGTDVNAKDLQENTLLYTATITGVYFACLT